jgi:hypothetical protein
MRSSNMQTKLFSLFVDVVGFGNAGAADAANVATPTDTQIFILTDTQIDVVAGGHLVNSPPPGTGWHYGTHLVVGWSVLPPGPTVEIGSGLHLECGKDEVFGSVVPCLF